MHFLFSHTFSVCHCITDDSDVCRAHRAVQNAAGRDQQPIRRHWLWTNVSVCVCVFIHISLCGFELCLSTIVLLLMFHVYF